MNIDYASFVLAHAAHTRLHANPAPPQPWSFLLFWQWKWHLCGSYDIVITVLPQWPFHFAIEFRAYDDVQRFSVQSILIPWLLRAATKLKVHYLWQV